MIYDSKIIELITAIKADKAITQPWRNKSVARLEEVQAFVRQGLTATNLQPPEGAVSTCICPVGGERADCPVHGNAG